jgi:hypothetical protein
MGKNRVAAIPQNPVSREVMAMAVFRPSVFCDIAIMPSLGLTSIAPSANEAQLPVTPLCARAIAFATAKPC